MSYTTVYSGTTVNPANEPQNNIQIVNSDDIQLTWPSNSSNTENANALVSLMIFDVDAMVTPGNLILPDATLNSAGFRSILINSSNDDLDIKFFDGSTFFTLPASATYAIFLTDTTTSNGTWLDYVWAEGVSSITSITQVEPDAGFTITPSSVTGGDGTFTFALTDTLASLEEIGADTNFGLVCLTEANTLTIREIVPGSDNITVENGDGVTGNISLALNLSPTFTTINVGNITISESTISSDISSGNFATFTDSNDANSALIGISSDNGNIFKLGCPDSLVSDIEYTVPSALPGQNNSVLAASSTGVINPQNYLTTGIAGAWAKFDGSGNTFIAGSNIASYVRNATGSFTLTFTKAFANLLFMGVGNCQSTDGSSYGVITYVIVDSLHVNVFTKATTGTPLTPTNFTSTNIAFFGQLS